MAYNPKAPVAKQLEGLRIDDVWTVIAPAPKSAVPTGGIGSFGYVVEDDNGNRAFLKALDYFDALKAPNTPLVLQAMTEAFNFECELLERCLARNLTNVVRPIQRGTLTLEHPIGKVDFIILELGDGDIRKYLDETGRLEIAWAFQTLHNVAKGLRQLHSAEIAHQDIKPSNIIVFDGGSLSKLSDLGTASVARRISPLDYKDVAGDPVYAPLELLYYRVDADWRRRRLACDLYLLGSLTVFLLLRVGTTAAVKQKLDPSLLPSRWGDSYEVALPFLVNAFDEVIGDVRTMLGRRINDHETVRRVVMAIRQLCHPDPAMRGHPSDHRVGKNPYSLERYVSEFDLLARRASYQAR